MKVNQERNSERREHPTADRSLGREVELRPLHAASLESFPSVDSDVRFQGKGSRIRQRKEHGLQSETDLFQILVQSLTRHLLSPFGPQSPQPKNRDNDSCLRIVDRIRNNIHEVHRA